MLHIDGSMGEGGGQVLRSSLGLSIVTGKPFRIERIRANREKPGLRRQHLTAVNAAATICGATVDGAALSSRQLTFTPGPVKPGDYQFDVGSAGSTTLVLQTILPPLLLADAPSTITLAGGTHNIYAPPLDFLIKSFLPIVNRLGPNVTITPERFGFYPAGGGRFSVRIEPPASRQWKTIDLSERGRTTKRCCEAIVARLPLMIAERELDVLRSGIGWEEDECFVARQLPDDEGPGNIVMIEIAHEHITNVFTGFGRRGVRAEAIADGALEEAVKFLASNVPVGEHLADQLLIPFALADGGSYVTSQPSLHTTTNIDVVRQFLDVAIDTAETEPGEYRIRISRG
jgi:RNA 3'-terminal phosphate cyclase (ATP)